MTEDHNTGGRSVHHAAAEYSPLTIRSEGKLHAFPARAVGASVLFALNRFSPYTIRHDAYGNMRSFLEQVA